jgi:hypothetical protein
MTPRPNTKSTLIKKSKKKSLALGYHVRPSRAKINQSRHVVEAWRQSRHVLNFVFLIEYVLLIWSQTFFNFFFPRPYFASRVVALCVRAREKKTHTFALVCTNASDACSLGHSLERFALVCTSACSRSFENSFLFS